MRVLRGFACACCAMKRLAAVIIKSIGRPWSYATASILLGIAAAALGNAYSVLLVCNLPFRHHDPL